MSEEQEVSDQSLAAHVIESTPLLYQEGAVPALDRPAHVRSASGIAWVGGCFVIVQDDANFIALTDSAGEKATAVTLPAGEAGKRQFDDERGNKKFKMDLESCVLAPSENGEVLVTFGSGSNPHRENIVVLSDLNGSPRPEVYRASALYAALRSEKDFAGSELNIEGAVFLGGKIRLFNRGNGASSENLTPVNASCDLDWQSLYAYLISRSETSPVLENIVRYDLGTLDDVPLGFTDATTFRDKLFFSAAAEDSPDAVTDGRVAGSVLGVISNRNQVEWTIIADAEGNRFGGKVEGITFFENDPDRLFVVVDQDSPNEASNLCEVRLSGSWS